MYYLLTKYFCVKVDFIVIISYCKEALGHSLNNNNNKKKPRFVNNTGNQGYYGFLKII